HDSIGMDPERTTCPAAADPPATARAALRSRPFATLLAGYAVSALGDGMVAARGLDRLLTRWARRLLVLAEAVVRAACLGLVAAGAVAGILTPAGYVALLGVSSLLGLLGVTGSLTAVAELLPEAQRL